MSEEWIVHDLGYGCSISGCGAWLGSSTKRTDEENLENARVIAASPELLAACELVELWMRGSQPGPHSDSVVLEKVRQAIQNAKGVSQ